MRKIFVFFSIMLIFTMLASLSGSVSAKPIPPDGPQSTTFPAGYHPPVSTPTNQIRKMEASVSVSPAVEENGKVRAQGAVLGKPGTVFAYAATFGQTDVPYFEDYTHLYAPNGLAFDSQNNLYVVEENGARLLKYDASKMLVPGPTEALIWRVGTAGVHDWGATGLNSPKEVAVAPDELSVWVADGDIVSQFDAGNGSLIRHFPLEPWNVQDDQIRFRDLRGIVFDSLGHLYLSDMGRQRIQIFRLDPVDGPVYEATIGGFNSPSQIAIDSDDTLYVTDVFDYTVKKCTPDKSGGWPWNWNCPVFFGQSNVQGDDNTHLGMAWGIGINLNHHVVYIADSLNKRLISCSSDGNCFPIIQGLGWPADVAVDPTDSTITLSDGGDNAIYRYFGEDHPVGPLTGDPRTPFISNPGNIPYLTDDMHFNQPAGVDVDAAGNLYIIEEAGARLTKLNAAGLHLWTLGEAGVSNPDDTSKLEWPRSVAADKRGNVIVGGNNYHVRIYNAITGLYQDTLDQGWGSGLYQFKNVNGVATDSANNIYVSDQELNLVKVFSYNPKLHTFAYLRTVGNGGDCGPGNNQFCNLRGITVDTASNLYVADHDNCRVQKFDKKGVYIMTFGSGVCGDGYSRLGGVTDVAVDATGRVYAADEWNNRIQVFDKTGAYLTSIAGDYSSASGGLRNPRGVALDKAGNVYVSDSTGSRVQKYSPSVPYWAQININGFGKRQVGWIFSLANFKNSLYAGGTNEYNQAQLWKMVGSTWQPVMSDGFEDGSNQAINTLMEFKGYLYAATVNCNDNDCNGSNGGELWRSPDGLFWQRVVGSGFDFDPNNSEIFRLSIIGGQICAGSWVYHNAHGAELWCSATGEAGSWKRVIEDGFDTSVILSMAEYSNTGLATGMSVYAATGDTYAGGAKVWRRSGPGTLKDTDTWTDITGWGTDYIAAVGLSVYKGFLYVGLRMAGTDDPLTQQGGAIYRCQKCDGTDWTAVVTNGLENKDSFRVYSLKSTPNGLYAFVGNYVNGIDTWYSKDGTTWTRPFLYGLGNSNNRLTYWENATLWWNNRLYLGVYNGMNGAGVWKLCPTTKVCK